MVLDHRAARAAAGIKLWSASSTTGQDPAAVDLTEIPDLVFQDLDHEMLFMPHLDGIANDEQLGAALGIGDELTVGGWLTPFDNAADRGHPLTWRAAPSSSAGPTG